MTVGYAPFGSYATWYEVVGESLTSVPLVLAHGGPGNSHLYFEPLKCLASSEQAVILYDQLDCGKSTGPGNKAAWTIQLFVDQLEALRLHLGIERFCLLGHSWGGWLAIEYALQHSDRLAGLILSSTSASVPQFVAEARRLAQELPAPFAEAIHHNEAMDTTGSSDYQAVSLAFMQAHVCRLQPWPELLRRAFAASNAQMYEAMWGPSEFHCTGSLGTWDATDRLGEIIMPTLVLSGRYDEMTPPCQQTLLAGLPDARWTMFDNSAHCAFLEETEAYVSEVQKFLKTVSSP